MGAIYILWLRELKRYVRSRVQIVVSLGQPCLYLLALGFGLGPVFQQAGHGSYLQFMAPGSPRARSQRSMNSISSLCERPIRAPSLRMSLFSVWDGISPVISTACW